MKRKIFYLKLLLFASMIILLSGANTRCILAAENAEQRELKVLVIEINPYLESKGMKVSDYFNTLGYDQSLEKPINEVKEDLEYSSHNVVKVNIVGKEYLNEFPKYTKKFTLSYLDSNTGQRVYTGKDYRLDEKTYLDIFGKGWYGWWESNNPVISEGIDSGYAAFDYDYLIEKFDLVKRRNDNEFDMVWIFSIDPLNMGETNMVGRRAFWVNGDTIYKDCDNFVICGFTLSRRDSALECIGHLAESMLNYVYQIVDYNSKLEFNSLDELNTWQRFYLCKDKAPDNWNVYGVGQIHFAPNSTMDYDWENMTPVKSTWKDWKNNYPNLTGETSEFTSAVYYDGCMDLNRAHKRWWFSLMPHVKGRDDNGYSHNWWDYIISLDFVDYIETYDTYIEDNLYDYYAY